MKALLISSVVALFVSTAASAACIAPPSPGNPPNGASATREQMLAAQNVLKEYNAAVTTYTECMTRTGGNVDRINDVISTLEKLADKFNVELRIFKQKSGA